MIFSTFQERMEVGKVIRGKLPDRLESLLDQQSFLSVRYPRSAERATWIE